MKTDVTLSGQTGTYNPRLLNFAARFWFIVAAAGQWIFGAYVLAVYYAPVFTGNFEKWNAVLPKGYVPGDWKGNTMVGVHVLLAAIIIIGGPLQIMPVIRNRYRVFHRWLGRTYVVTAILVSAAGLIMMWTRGTVGDKFMHITNSIQAVYIVVFALLSIRYARRKQFDQHRQWALRLYMVTNGVWFFRVGLMAWLMINQGPAGFDPESFTGPFLTFLSLFTYALPIPLILLEMYFYAQKTKNPGFSAITSVAAILFALVMIIGIAGAAMGMWWPRM